MKTYVLLALLLGSTAPAVAAEANSASVQLVVADRKTDFGADDQARLQRQITALLKSSNFHSGAGDRYHTFTARGVQQDYRDAVAAGEYLLMILSAAETIGTAGGEVAVTEVVVGLRRPSGKNAVFTIDESGTITGHAKYSGGIFMELQKTVAHARH